MVLLLPPAPAARVLFGLALATFSFWSAAARRRMTARAPPGGGGESGRAPVAVPVAGGEFTGEVGRGEDCGGSGPVSIELERAGGRKEDHDRLVEDGWGLWIMLYVCVWAAVEDDGWGCARTILLWWWW